MTSDNVNLSIEEAVKVRQEQRQEPVEVPQEDPVKEEVQELDNQEEALEDEGQEDLNPDVDHNEESDQEEDEPSEPSEDEEEEDDSEFIELDDGQKIEAKEAAEAYLLKQELESRAKELEEKESSFTQLETQHREGLEKLSRTTDAVTNVLWNNEILASVLGVPGLDGKKLDEIAETDPQEFVKIQHKLNKYKEMVAQVAQSQDQVFAEHHNSLWEKSLQVHPELGDESERTKIAGYLRENGFDDHEIALVRDHRFFKVIKDALRGKSTITVDPKVKRKTEKAPKVLKKKARPSKSQNNAARLKEAQEKVNKVLNGGSFDEQVSAMANLKKIKRELRNG